MRETAMALVIFFCTTTAFAGSAGFKDNGNGTVTDSTTNLMWQQCTAGWNGAGCANDDLAVPNAYTWDYAITYCEALSLGGFTDWRLPKVKELQSIVDMTLADPAINTTYFPTATSYYWSSTTYAPNTAFAWYVEFRTGYAYDDAKTPPHSGYYVRCVRGQ